jgi:PhnB protein
MSLATPSRYRNSVIAHVMVNGAAAAIDFYRSAFGATELFRISAPDGKIIHAEIMIEHSIMMVGDASEPFSDAKSLGGTCVGLHVYVQDVDSMSRKAVAAGAEELQPLQDMFYGDRQTTLRDPFGHIWVLLTHQEDVAPEEIVSRAKNLFSGNGTENPST